MAYVCMFVCVCVSACMCARVRACVCVCVYMCVSACKHKYMLHNAHEYVKTANDTVIYLFIYLCNTNNIEHIYA